MRRKEISGSGGGIEDVEEKGKKRKEVVRHMSVFHVPWLRLLARTKRKADVGVPAVQLEDDEPQLPSSGKVVSFSSEIYIRLLFTSST